MTGPAVSRSPAAAIPAERLTRAAWPVVRLGELLIQHKEYIDAPDPREYPKLSVKLYGRGVVLDPPVDGATLKMRRHQIAHAGQVILSEIWGKRGAIGLVPPDGEGALCTSHFFLFDVNQERLTNGWLKAIFRANFLANQLDAYAFGTTGYAAVRPKDLLACEIPLPPLSEQRRIVAKLDQLSARVEESRRLRDAITCETGRLLGSRVRDVFTRREGTGWINGTLGDYVRDACYGTSERTHAEPRGVAVLRMGNIQEGSLYTRDLRYLQIADRDREKWILRRGDLLVNRTNSAELVGKSAVFDLDGDWAFASYIIRLRIDHERADPWLISRFVNSPSGRAYMFDSKKQMTGQANVNLQTLRSLPLSLPPLDQQRRLAPHLNRFEVKARAAAAMSDGVATELDALMPAMLDRAFKGEL